MSAKPSARQYTLLIAFFLIGATSLAYGPVKDSQFFAWDDAQYVFENSHVQKGLTPETVIWAFKTTDTGNWHPLTWLSLMVDHTLYGSDPQGYHLTNLFFHMANAVVLFVVLQAMTSARWESAVVAALFALHPFHVESVAWVAERKDVLSTFLGLLTLSAYHRYTKANSWQTYAAVLVLYAMGLMAKSSLVTLPFVLILLDFWPLRRIVLCDADRQSSPVSSLPVSVSLPRCLFEKAPLFILSGILGIITYTAQHDAGWIKDVSLNHRIGNALVSYGTYFVKTIWPVNLGVMYPYPSDPFPVPLIVGAALFMGAALFLSIRYARRFPYLLVGLLWYLGTFVPMIGLVRIGEHAIADRYTYVPLIGLFIMTVWAVSDMSRRWQYRHRSLVLAATGSAALSLLAVDTYIQTGYWKDSISLFKHTLQVTDDNCLVHNDLGMVLSDAERPAEAEFHYRKAIDIWPRYPKAHKNLADLLSRQARDQKAEALYLRAIEYQPGYLEAYSNLSQHYFHHGEYGKSISYLRKALEMGPEQEWLHTNMAMVLAASGEPDQAKTHYAEALRLDAEDGETHFKFAVFLVSTGDTRMALNHLSESIRINPENALAYYHAGIIFAQAAKLDDAHAFLLKSVTLNPRLFDAWGNLRRVSQSLANREMQIPPAQ